MFQTFFNKVATIVYQNHYSFLRTFKFIFILFFILGSFLLIAHYKTNDNSIYGNPIFALMSIFSFMLALFSVLGSFMFSFIEAKLTFKQYIKYVILPKKKITLKYVKENFDNIYQVFEQNHKTDYFRNFYNCLEKNTLTQEEYEKIYDIMAASSFKFNVAKDHNSQDEQSFEKMVLLAKNKNNNKSLDIKFFDNENL